MKKIKVDRAVVFKSGNSMVVGVVVDINNNGVAIKTLDSGYGSDFECYYNIPLKDVRIFNLAFFDEEEKAGRDGYYYDLQEKKARLKEKLRRVKANLRDCYNEETIHYTK